MKRILLTASYAVTQSLCFAANMTVAGVPLDSFLAASQKLEKYYQTLGQLDYALEDAIIHGSGIKIHGIVADRDYAQHGKDVKKQHNEHASAADEAYKTDKFASCKSTAPGLPHAFGKHMQILDANIASNKEKIRQNALNIHYYISTNETLLDTYNKLKKKADTSEKKQIIDVMMKYLAIASAIQEADSFAVGEYEKNGKPCRGVAFFTQSIPYYAGNSPEILFIPVRCATEKNTPYVASIYPLGSLSRLSYKLNPGTLIDEKKDKLFEIEDVPNSFKTLITWPQDIYQQKEQHTSKGTTASHKTIYETTSNPFKIRLGRNTYDVLPAIDDKKTFELLLNTARSGDYAKRMEELKKMLCDMPTDTEDTKNKIQLTSQLVQNIEHCAFSGCENIRIDALKTLLLLDERMEETMVQLGTSKETSIFCPYTPDEATEVISSVNEPRHTLTTSIVSYLFNGVVLADRVQLFIECFYNLLSDKFFKTFPQTLDILDDAILPAFRRIINSKSPIAKARHRQNVISRRKKVRAIKELAIEIHTDEDPQQQKAQKYFILLSELFLEHEELLTELTYIQRRITGIAIDWKIQEKRYRLLRPLLGEFANRISFALNRYEKLTTKVREKINGIDKRICDGIPQPFEEAGKNIVSHAKAAVEYLHAKDPDAFSAANELLTGVKDSTILWN